MKKLLLIISVIITVCTFSSCNNKKEPEFTQNGNKDFKMTEYVNGEVHGYWTGEVNGDGQIKEIVFQDGYRIEFGYHNKYLVNKATYYSTDGNYYAHSIYTLDENDKYSMITDYYCDTLLDEVPYVDADDEDKIKELKESKVDFVVVKYDSYGRTDYYENYVAGELIDKTISLYCEYGYQTEITYDAEGNEIHRLEWDYLD